MPKRFVLSELSSHPIVMDVPDDSNPGPDLVVTPLGLRVRRADEPVQSSADRQAARAVGAEFRSRLPSFESPSPHPFLGVMQLACSDCRLGEPRRSTDELIERTRLHDLSPAALDVARQEVRRVYDAIFDLPDKIRVFCKRLVRALGTLPKLPQTDHELRQLLFDTLAGPGKGTWSSALYHARENLERQFSDAMVRAGYEVNGPDAWVLKHVTWPWA